MISTANGGTSSERSTLLIGGTRLMRGYAPGVAWFPKGKSIIRTGRPPLFRDTRLAGKTDKNWDTGRAANLVRLVAR